MKPIFGRLIPLLLLAVIVTGTYADYEIESEQKGVEEDVVGLEVTLDDSLYPTNSSRRTTWQTSSISTHDRLAHLHSSGYLSDVTLLLKEHDKEFKVHRLVLSMSSPIFEEEMSTLALKGRKELSLKGVSPKVLMKLLDHMYLDTVELESVDLALQVYSSAHFFHLDALMIKAQQYVIAMMKEEDTLKAYELALGYHDQEITQKCIRMLNREGDAVFSADSVARMKKATFKNLLKQDLAVSSEVVLLNSVINWGKAQLSEDPSGDRSLRKKIKDLLRQIRFLSMTCDEFIDNVVDKNLFTDTEVVQLLKVIRGVDPDSTLPSSVPTSHSKKRRRRNRKSMFELTFDCKTIKPKSFMLDQVYGDFLVRNLTVSEEIQLDSMTTTVEGTIAIQNQAGSTLVSVTSEEENTYTFPNSVILRHGESYNIFYKPKGPKLMNQAGKNRKTKNVEYATFSFISNFCADLKMYFW